MRVFEAEVGQKLIIRHGRGILLTDKAHLMVPDLTEIITKIDSIRNAAALGEEAGRARAKTLAVATFEVFSTYFFENVLATSMKEYSCSIHEMVPGKMEAAVASGVADIALTYIPIPHPELDFLKIAPIKMGIFGQCQQKAPSDYRKLRFAVPVSPIEGSPNKVRGLDGWPDDAFPRNVVYRVQMLETALGLCRRGLAYAYIPRFIARLHNETVKPAFALKEADLPASFPKRHDFVYLIKRKSDTESPEAKKIASAVRLLCSEG
jgi:DNA-binding transcriptional LysR family regulator